jgi:hypothetical protein
MILTPVCHQALIGIMTFPPQPLGNPGDAERDSGMKPNTIPG